MAAQYVIAYHHVDSVKSIAYVVLVLQECFTRVLKGHINLSTVVFPNTVKGTHLATVTSCRTNFLLLCWVFFLLPFFHLQIVVLVI